jgi:hypothetical protein
MQPWAYLSAGDNSGPLVWHSLVGEALSIPLHAYFTDIESSNRSSSSRVCAQQGNKRYAHFVYLIYSDLFNDDFSSFPVSILLYFRVSRPEPQLFLPSTLQLYSRGCWSWMVGLGNYVKDFKIRGRVLIKGPILVFAWRNWGNTQITG